MKELNLGGGKAAKCCVEYGEKQPELDRPPVKPGQKTYQDTFRSVTVKITVTENGEEVGEFEGVSYCSPTDRWDRTEGRRKAIRRAFDQDNEQAVAKMAVEGAAKPTRQLKEKFQVLDTHARTVLTRELLPWIFEKDEEKAQTA